MDPGARLKDIRTRLGITTREFAVFNKTISVLLDTSLSGAQRSIARDSASYYIRALRTLFRLTILAMRVRSRRMIDKLSLIVRISVVNSSRSLSLAKMSILEHPRIKSEA